MVSRTQQVPANSSVTTNTSTGPSSSTTNTSTSGSQSSSSQGGSKSTTTYNVRNMSKSALAALDQLIAGLNSGGGNSQAAQNAQFLRDQWMEQLQASNQLRSDYSKSAAFTDSEGAANAALAKALEESMPVISAGIDAAGTSGGSMSALLTQQAAEDAARMAASLRLDAAISYGQIAANALNTGAGLVNQGDPVMNALLDALGIAKGSVQQGSTSTDESNWQSSKSSSSSNSTSTTANSGQNQSSTQNTINTPSTGGPAARSPAATPTSTVSSSQQNWITPSSYRSSNVNKNGNSYSQFG